jgi:hypothetical protein
MDQAVEGKGEGGGGEIMRISREPSPVQIVRDQKQLKNVGYLNCLGSTITNDARCTREVKYHYQNVNSFSDTSQKKY